MVKVEVELQLARLTFDQFGVRRSKKPDRFETQMRGSRLRSPCHQKIAGEDGDGVGPVGVDRGCTPACVRFVDDVVVVEAADVDQLDRDPGLDRFVVGRGSELPGENCKKRPVPFAACLQEVLGDLGELGVVGR